MLVLVACLICGFDSCKKGKRNSEACNGDTRRSVKLMSDVSAPIVDTQAIFTTIDSLGAWPVPEVDSETGRQDVEKQVYTVRCTVKEVDRKRDGNYHILLQDGDKYLIAEVPNPECDYAGDSPYLSL